MRIKKSVRRPYAYVISEKEERLVDLLFKHQIEMGRLQADTEMEVETYSILHVTPATEEDKESINVDVDVQIETKTFVKGSMVIFLNQRASNLIPLLLEPQSSWGIVTSSSGRRYRFSDYITEGKQYPIFRLMNVVELDTELSEGK